VVFLSVSKELDSGALDETTGTGFLVHPDGYVLTCAHVVPSPGEDSASTIRLAAVGGRHEHAYPFSVVKHDPQVDLALLKLKERAEPWPVVNVALDARIAPGQEIFAMGYPGGGELDGVDGIVRGEADGGRFVTNAAIDRGSSGGPVFARDGRVVAVAKGAESNGQLRNLIVPVELAASWLRDIRAGTQPRQVQPPAEVRPARLPSSADATIERIVQQMDVRALLGQALMVGFVTDVEGKGYVRANEHLADLVRDYGIGSVILYAFNFPDHTVAEPGETAIHIANLTARLQTIAYESQPPERKLPLLIAVDQEGGTDVRIRRDITRMPDQIHLGVTRNPALVERVGIAVGRQLAALGINVNLSPVADINTKHDTDLIGRRSFSSRPDIAAALSVALARGLQKGGVLAIAKHYPGHGNSSVDPHRAVSDMGYETRAELEENDAVPFKAVAQAGVDGIMTSHMLTPLDRDLPTTISTKSIRYLREELRYDGLVVTDDIVDMMGILMDRNGKKMRERPEVAIQALRAGHDLILFGCVALAELDANPERTVTRAEFDEIFTTLLRHFESHQIDREILRASVRRILRAKARVATLNGRLDEWSRPFDPIKFRALVDEGTELAKEVTRASAILVTEQGRVIDDAEQAAHFRAGVGPLSRGELWNDGDRILLVSPVTTPPDELYEALSSRGISRDLIQHYPLIWGWTDEASRKRAEALWKRSAPVYSRDSRTGQEYLDATILPEAERIVAAAKNARVIIFSAVKHEHLRILNRVFRKLRNPSRQIIVLLHREPYFAVDDLYTQSNVTVLNLSSWPTPAVAAGFLFGDFRPLPATALSVPVTKVVERPVGLLTPKFVQAPE